jgi:hypothetical protein
VMIMNNFIDEIKKLEMQLVLNRKLYDNKIINNNMYNFISNKLNKKLHIKKNISNRNSKE